MPGLTQRGGGGCGKQRGSDRSHRASRRNRDLGSVASSIKLYCGQQSVFVGIHDRLRVTKEVETHKLSGNADSAARNLSSSHLGGSNVIGPIRGDSVGSLVDIGAGSALATARIITIIRGQPNFDVEQIVHRAIITITSENVTNHCIRRIGRGAALTCHLSKKKKKKKKRKKKKGRKKKRQNSLSTCSDTATRNQSC